MDKEYLLKPVIEVEDGDELKAFSAYNLFVISFFFGILPALFLSIKNCIWMRIGRNSVILIIAISFFAFISKFIILGIYYNDNIEYLKSNQNTDRRSISRQLPTKITSSTTNKIVEKTPEVLAWERFKKNISLYEKAFSLLLTFISFLIYRDRYNVVKNLTGGIQPILKWAIGCIIAAALVELMISQVFFGGIL